jgi:hypothetical protein
MEIAITKNKAELERLEGIIRRNQQSFYEIGMALREIRDKELYRDVLGYETYEAYVKARWDFNRAHAYRLIDSASVVDSVSPMGDKKPENERQVRPLTKLRNDPEKQKEAWQLAIATAPDGKVTAAHVASIVRGMTGEEKKESAPKIKSLPKMPEHAVYFATCAISHLERICDTDPSKQEALDMVQNWIDKHK